MTQTERLTSRKFIVTLTAMTMATVLAILGKLDVHSAAVLGAGIAAYNWANVVGGKNVNNRAG